MVLLTIVNQIAFELVMLRACAEAAEASLEPVGGQNSDKRMTLGMLHSEDSVQHDNGK